MISLADEGGDEPGRFVWEGRGEGQDRPSGDGQSGVTNWGLLDEQRDQVLLKDLEDTELPQMAVLTVPILATQHAGQVHQYLCG